MANSLNLEIDAFMEQLPEMLKHHKGKVSVFSGSRPLGFYDNERNAYEAGIKTYGNVPMLLRKVSQEYIIFGKMGRPLFIPILAFPELR